MLKLMEMITFCEKKSGYMSPEYAMDGIYSEKSDVFSFGVMILEIITGKKNTSFYDSDRHLNLIGHVSYRYNAVLLVSFPSVQ